jgi:hypothetical protein
MLATAMVVAMATEPA